MDIQTPSLIRPRAIMRRGRLREGLFCGEWWGLSIYFTLLSPMISLFQFNNKDTHITITPIKREKANLLTNLPEVDLR